MHRNKTNITYLLRTCKPLSICYTRAHCWLVHPRSSASQWYGQLNPSYGRRLRRLVNTWTVFPIKKNVFCQYFKKVMFQVSLKVAYTICAKLQSNFFIYLDLKQTIALFEWLEPYLSAQSMCNRANVSYEVTISQQMGLITSRVVWISKVSRKFVCTIQPNSVYLLEYGSSASEI